MQGRERMPRRPRVGSARLFHNWRPEAEVKVLITAAALILSGCFSYIPAELGSVRPGEEIRLQLAAQGASDLAAVSGGGGTSVAGMLVGTDAAAIRVRVPVGVMVEGVTTRSLGQEVVIPRSQISAFERRQLNRPRTVGAVAGGVAALVAVLLAYGEIQDNPEISIPNPPDEIRIPLFSVPLW
jgi:hypothetical protein